MRNLLSLFSIFSSICFLKAMSSHVNCKTWLSVFILDVIFLSLRLLSISETSLHLVTPSGKVLVSTLFSNSPSSSSKDTGYTGDKSSANLLTKVVDKSSFCKRLSTALGRLVAARDPPQRFSQSL